jgi:hypothetical protein
MIAVRTRFHHLVDTDEARSLADAAGKAGRC